MLEVRVLGPFEVSVDGRALKVGSPSQRRILSALVVGDGFAGRDRLIDALWGEAVPASAAHSLDTYISRLRRALGPARITTRPPGWVLHADVVDVWEFERLVSEAGQLSGRAALAALDAGLAWWRGPAYEEFATEPFAMAEARRIEELRLTAQVERAATLLAIGGSAEAVAALESLVVDDPLHERSWELLICALARSGRPAEALRAAQRCRRELAAVGLEVSPAVAAAERAVLDAEHIETPPPHAPARSVQLPPARGVLVGRDAERDRVEGLLAPGTCVTLVGPGGVGKSRLALEVAHRAASRFDDGVFFCDLTSVEEDEAVVPTLAAAFGAPLVVPVEQKLHAFCAPLRALLLLDNCEHVIAEVARVAAFLLAGAPGLALVATSREPLHIQGERAVPLAPLTVGDAVSLYRWLVDAAGGVTDDASAVEALCSRLDNLPLAIEMAAGWSRSLTASEITTRLDDQLTLMQSVRRDVPFRHQSLDSAVSWSYDLLTESERSLFSRLSVFAGPVDFDSALAIGAPGLAREEAGRRLMNLVDRSLVVAELGRQSRFRLLDTIRRFAAAQLRRRGEHDSTVHDHAMWAAAIAETGAAGIRTGDAAEWVARLEAALPELRAAVFRTLDAGKVETALRIVAALALPTYDWLRADIADWAQRAIEAAHGAGITVPPDAHVCAALGPLHAGDFDAARRMVEGVSGPFAAVVRSDVGIYTGDLALVVDQAEAAIEAAREDGDSVLEALGLLNVAIAQGYGGDVDRGLSTAASQRSVAEQTGSPLALAWADFLEGELLLDRSPYRAAPLLERALRRAREIHSAYTEGIALVSLTTLRARHGDPEEAIPAFEDAVRHWYRVDDWTHQHVTLRNLVLLLERLRADRQAAVLLGAVDRQRSALGADAERLAFVRHGLRRRLGSEFESLVATGEGLEAREVVERALAALASVRSAPAGALGSPVGGERATRSSGETVGRRP